MRTCAKKVEKGSPLSRAKAQVKRETEAKMAYSAPNATTRVALVMAVAAALELVAELKISIIGYPVLDSRASL